MSGSVNNPNASPSTRAPLLQILLNGNPVPGALSASWTSTSHFAPDTWQASFAVNKDPTKGVSWWEGIDIPIILDVQTGIGAPGGAVAWKSLGIGQVDDFEADLERGTVSVSGRDLAALMLEEKTAEAFQNQSPGQIVSAIAARHGMTADVQDPGGLSERFYNTDHTRETHMAGSRATNEWDLLVRLAQQAGCDLYVTGRTLHFRPLPQAGDKPYSVKWNASTATAASPTSNAIGLRMHHKMQLAKQVTVEVHSFHSRKGGSIVATATSPGARTAGVVSGSVFVQKAKKPQKYIFTRPNLTQDQAQALANSLLADITRHERTISWQEPANGLLTPRNVVRLEGTGTGFDTVANGAANSGPPAYYVDTVTNSISFDGGFMMSVSCKAHSALATQAIAGGAVE